MDGFAQACLYSPASVLRPPRFLKTLTLARFENGHRPTKQQQKFANDETHCNQPIVVVLVLLLLACLVGQQEQSLFSAVQRRSARRSRRR